MSASSSQDTQRAFVNKLTSLVKKGRSSQALALLKESPVRHAGDPSIYLIAARASIITGARKDAERWLDLASRSRPSAARAWKKIGLGYVELRRMGKAAICFQHAASIDPFSAKPLILLARTRLDQGRPNEAWRTLEKARALDPEDAEAATVMAVLLEKRGELTEALAVLESHANSLEAEIDTLLCWSRVCRALNIESDLIRRLRSHLKRSVPDCVKSSLLFELAAQKERLQDYEGAFEDARRANILAAPKFDPESFERLIQSVLDVGVGVQESAPVGQRPCRFDPIFIVGVPRSGTTLVEQILSMHPQILAIGEHTRLQRAAERWAIETGEPYPYCLSQGDAHLLEKLRGDYLGAITDLSKATRWITDKMPTNFLRLGVAARLFPGARVVRCTRDPLDTGVSCFFQEFGGPETEFAGKMEHIGRFISAESRLMSFWRRALSLPLIEMPYESLVSDPVNSAKRLLSFLDLDWADDCLRFHESRRYVATPSSAQVRCPVYRTSIGRHRHYASHLQPLFEALQISE